MIDNTVLASVIVEGQLAVVHLPNSHLAVSTYLLLYVLLQANDTM